MQRHRFTLTGPFVSSIRKLVRTQWTGFWVIRGCQTYPEDIFHRIDKIFLLGGERMQYKKGKEDIHSSILCKIMVAGFVLGIILMCFGKQILYESTDVLSEYTLTEMKNAVVDHRDFFWYLLRKRVGIVLILALLSTTWMGMAAAWTGAAWLGISFGMLVTTAMMRYGIKGVFLVGTGLFPQILLYFPAAILLLRWSYEFFTAIYYPERCAGGIEGIEKKQLLRKKGIRYLCLVGVVIIGCALESYVNPVLVLNLLQFF